MAAPQVAQIPFHLDWKFWLAAFSLTASVVAIVLSQLPPLRILLRRTKLDLEVYSRMALAHTLGNPTSQMHLIIRNAGGRDVRVKSIELSFLRDSKDRFTLPAQNYFQSPNDSNGLLLTSFALKPNEEWGHIVNFFMLFSRTEEKERRQLEANLRNDIIQKRNALADQNVNVPADEVSVHPLVRFFKEHFRWEPGEYELTVEVQAEPASASVSKKYHITVFESDSKELEDFCDDYKYGFGVFLISQRQPVFVGLREA